MALDEPKDTDETFDVEGLTYLVDKDLLERVQPITVSFSAMGFYVSGRLDSGCSSSACGSCGS